MKGYCISVYLDYYKILISCTTAGFKWHLEKSGKEDKEKKCLK